jgi:hypothetical protein
MKKMLFTLLFMLMLYPTLAQAAWTDDFLEDLKKFGLDTAVENAILDDITPEEILSLVMSNPDQFSTKNTLKSIYCAGADRDDILEISNKLGIEPTMRAEALEESVAECSQRLVLDDRENSGILIGTIPPGTVPPPPEFTPHRPNHPKPRPHLPSSPSTP